MRELQYPAELHVRAEGDGGDGRTVDMRIVPFGVLGTTANGLEMVERGAFEGTDPDSVVLRQDHLDPPAGRGTSLEEREDGAYMTFRVARTPRGDELLSNLVEGMHRHASIGFEELPGGSTTRAYRGDPVRVHRRLRLREVGTTWRPVYPDAAVLAVRMEDLDVEQTTDAAAAPPTPSLGSTAPPAALQVMANPDVDALRARIVELEERSRQAIAYPAGLSTTQRDDAILRGRWASLALRSLAGERVDAAELAAVLQTRAVADVTTPTNLGVVPPQYRTEVIGVINRSRPFMESTREVPAGNSGLTFNFPKLGTRPLTGVQAGEKTELPSRATTVTTESFEAVSIGGVGDISLQLLQRSSPQFLTLWLDLLAESYGINADSEALTALLAEVDVVEGGVLDPGAPNFGGAFTNAAAAANGSAALIPDRLWMSTAAVAAFIDAKSPAGGGGLPMYPGLATISGITRNDGNNGAVPLAMTPVWVPSLDGRGLDLVAGPSRGFAWAEDGTYTLQADVPSKAGRDVGLVGMLWFMPMYPAAFTSYTLAP